MTFFHLSLFEWHWSSPNFVIASMLFFKIVSCLLFPLLNSWFCMVCFFWICHQDVQHVAHFPVTVWSTARFLLHCRTCTFKGDGTLRKRKSYTTARLWKSNFPDSLKELPWNFCLVLKNFSLISQYTATTILNFAIPVILEVTEI